jgi:hypothetical protein
MTPKQEQAVSFPIRDVGVTPNDGALASIASPARADICALSPDPARDQLSDHPLWLLHKVSNRDKHRSIHIFAAGAAIGEMGIGNGRIEYAMDTGPQRLEYGEPPRLLFQFKWSADTQAKIRPSLQIVFDQGTEVSDREVGPTLRWFHDHIRDAVFQCLENHL